MKILLLHTYYQIKGGEDSVFSQEYDLLSKSHEVKTVTFNNRQGLKGGIQFMLSVWNLSAAAQLRKEIESFHPDVIHIHNLHFGIGPIAIRVAKSLGIPVVLTLHNYRLLCPSAILQHNGQLFTDSLSASFPWLAIRKKVYRNSILQTFWLAFTVWFHKIAGTWKKVDRYIALTDFAKQLFSGSSLGLAEGQIVVKPNFVESGSFKAVPRENHFLFVGRLMEEKGIRVLLEAFRDTDLKLQIAGSGPLIEEVQRAADTNSNIRYLGNLNTTQVYDAMQRCTALIFPSTWYEGMPMTILEAFSFGTPVIASNIGAMATMIEDGVNGLHFNVGDSQDLSRKLTKWQSFPELEKMKFIKSAAETFNACYSSGINAIQLDRIYTTLQSEKDNPSSN